MKERKFQGAKSKTILNNEYKSKYNIYDLI